LNSTSYSPAGFSSLTRVAVSLPRISKTFSITKVPPLEGFREAGI